MKLRLGHRLDSLRATLHNGPGWRIGLWVQGCRHRCTEHCLSPHLLDPTGGREFDTSVVQVAIEAAAEAAAMPVEGVTVLGGEPFEQAEALAELLEPLRRVGLSTMVYSGHTLEHLRRSVEPGVATLLATTDLLVDGPFLPQLYGDELPWRGSSNQRLLCLTPRYDDTALAAAFERQRKGFSLQIGGGRVSVSGLQSRPAAQAAEDSIIGGAW